MTINRRLLVLVLAGLPVACASPSPNQFVLEAWPGTIRHGAPKSIVVRPISLARYLERPQIVRSVAGYRVEQLPNDWWGEPLDAMVLRILVEELSERLPDSTVVADTGAITPKSDVAVEVNLQRMDLDAAGTLDLAAQIAVDARSVRSTGVALSIKPQADTTSALVGAMSMAIGQLADAIVLLLVQR